MFKIIKDKFYKKELEKIQTIADNLDFANEEIQKQQLKKEQELQKKESIIQKREYDLKKKLKEEFKKEFKEKLEENIKILWDIRKFKLLPWNKVWWLEWYSNDINQIEVESLFVTKEEIRINFEWFWQKELFWTEKEAIEAYNKHLEGMKRII